jgi:hypothetical protein
VCSLEKASYVQKLFELFLPPCFWDAVLKWTYKTLTLSKSEAVTKQQLMELALSIQFLKPETIGVLSPSLVFLNFV